MKDLKKIQDIMKFKNKNNLINILKQKIVKTKSNSKNHKIRIFKKRNEINNRIDLINQVMKKDKSKPKKSRYSKSIKNKINRKLKIFNLILYFNPHYSQKLHKKLMLQLLSNKHSLKFNNKVHLLYKNKSIIKDLFLYIFFRKKLINLSNLKIKEINSLK